MTVDVDQPLIAVDGGGTGCRVAAGTIQRGILGQAKGKSANVSTDFEGAIANIIQTAQQAIEAARLPAATLAQSVAHLGLAGADLDDTRAKTSAALPFAHSRISGDRQTTVAGVLGPQDGFVVALGTGTIIARQKASLIKTVSGWGFQLSDRASGAWLGRSLLTYVLDAEEGLEAQTNLTRTVADRLGGVEGVFKFSNGAVPGKYAKFAPEIFEAGKAGDPFASAVLQEGACYIDKGLTALGFRQGDVLCLSGGVGPHYAPYLPAAYRDNIHPPQGNALQGAFALAQQFAQSVKTATG